MEGTLKPRLILLCALALLGLLLWGQEAHAYPTEEITSERACTKYANSVTGNDSNGGTTPATAVKTFKALESKMVAGDVGCVRGGVGQKYEWLKAAVDPATSDVFQIIDAPDNSPSTNRTTFQSEPGYPRAELIGDLRIKTGVVLTDLKLNGFNRNGDNDATTSIATATPSPLVTGDGVGLFNNHITNDNTGICVHPKGTLSNKVEDLMVGSNRIYNCGPPEQLDPLWDHGIYLSYTRNAQIYENYIYDNVGRGINLRLDADGSYIGSNVIDSNGGGIIFSGEDTNISDDNRVESNIITNSDVRFDVESWYPSTTTTHGVGNIVQGNCIFNGKMGNFKNAGDGYTVGTDNKTGGGGDAADIDPGFVNAAAKDFRLKNTSPCLHVTIGNW